MNSLLIASPCGSFSNWLKSECGIRCFNSAIPSAVLAATADIKDPAQVLKIALGFATAAAKAAPAYVDAIVGAVSAIPGITDIEGALTEIQTAVSQAAKNASDSDADTARPQNQRPPSSPEFGGDTGDVVVSPSS